MRFDRAIVFGFVCVMTCFLVVGCQKKAGQDTTAQDGISQVQRDDRQVTEDSVNVTSRQTTRINEGQTAARVPEGSRAATHQEEMASSEDEPVGDEGNEEQVSFGRMVGGVFRAARSLVPVPAAGSSDAPKEPSTEAPPFPQR